MFAARQRVGVIARQAQRAARTRTYASHAHEKAHEVNESFGKGSIVTVATFFTGVLLYQFTPKEGETSAISTLLNEYQSKNEDWAEINQAHVDAVKQASYDRTLFNHGNDRQRFVDVSFPEALQSHSSRNIRAGQIANIDHAVEHYRTKHVQDEERKAAKLAAAAAAAAKLEQEREQEQN